MANTEFKFDPEFLQERTAQAKVTLKSLKGRDDFVQHACDVIKERLLKDNEAYLSYGPYWWALKKVLLANGFKEIGKTMDEPLAKEYCGKSDEETIMAAESFREDYFTRYFAGNNSFELDPESDTPYWLHDPDCKSLKFRGKFASLGLDEEEQRKWEEMAAFFGDDYLK